jgi:hypothetical protein
MKANAMKLIKLVSSSSYELESEVSRAFELHEHVRRSSGCKRSSCNTGAKQQARRCGGVVSGEVTCCESVGQGGEQRGAGTYRIVICSACVGNEGRWGAAGGGVEEEQEQEEQTDAKARTSI